MNNVLKKALVFTGIYFVFCIAWLIFLIAVQLFWKPVIAAFAILVVLFTFDHVRGTNIMLVYNIWYMQLRSKFA